jgi:hypothetical protein
VTSGNPAFVFAVVLHNGGMGSVIVSWSDSCPERAVREALMSALEPIARLSHSYFEHPPAVELFDKRVDGGVVCQAVGEKYDAAVPITDGEEDDPGAILGFELRPAGPLNTTAPVTGPLYSVPPVGASAPHSLGQVSTGNSNRPSAHIPP